MTETNPMTKFMWQKLILLLIIGFGVLLFAQWMKPKPDTVHVYLVRHGEKLTGPDAGKDPALSPEGQARAQILAATLARKDISHIHSSDTKRTRNTAKPLADELGLTIEIYDPRQLDALAAAIKAAPGGHLVVGHSNTIPETVIALGGDGGAPINEASEYDRLYTVTIDKDGHVTSALSHYGARYQPQDSSQKRENTDEQ